MRCWQSGTQPRSTHRTSGGRTALAEGWEAEIAPDRNTSHSVSAFGKARHHRRASRCTCRHAERTAAASRSTSGSVSGAEISESRSTQSSRHAAPPARQILSACSRAPCATPPRGGGRSTSCSRRRRRSTRGRSSPPRPPRRRLRGVWRTCAAGTRLEIPLCIPAGKVHSGG
jgi:hypothetical protein